MNPDRGIIAMGAIGVMLIMWWLVVTLELLVPAQVQARPGKKKFRTGDLVFFSGKSWTEKTIKTVTGSRYNHVGMIVRAREKGEIKYYVMESDVTIGYRDGPRLVPLEHKLSTWKGERQYGYRPISKSLDTQQALAFISSRAGAGFDRGMWSFFFPGTKYKEMVAVSDYFCSEFIAEFLIESGVLPDSDPTDYSPQDLWNLGPPYGPHQTIPFD